jgi:tetratricopeptide (TPR) repeat protein
MKKNLHGFVLILLVIIVFGAWGIKHALNRPSESGQSPVSTPERAAGADPEKMMASVRAQIEHLQQLAEGAPNDPHILTALGNIYFDAGMAQQAIEYYDRVLALEPDNIEVMVDKATMLRSLGRPAEALRLLENVVAARPGHEQALFNMGVIYSTDLGDEPAAIRAWKSFLAAHPAAPHADAVRQEIQRLEHQAGGQ